MAKRTFLAGATSQTIDVFIPDSSSLVGLGLSGLVYNTSNLKCYYRKGATGTPAAVTLATQTVGGAWSSGGFVEVDATNMKGVYRFDIPDTVLAAAPMATLFFYGAANMAPVPVELEIVAYNPFDATRLGLTALPNSGNLAKTVAAIGRGTVTTGGSTTSVPTSAFAPAGAVADQFKGRVILFDADTTTAALRGVSAAITASSNSATPTFTVGVLPAAPASGDTFSVI